MDAETDSHAIVNPGPGALAIIDRATAELHTVHSYALQQLGLIEKRIGKLKHAIELQKNRSQQEVTIYIETVDGALKMITDIERLVDDIEQAMPRSKEPA